MFSFFYFQVFCIETLHSIGLSVLAFIVLPSFDPASASVVCLATAFCPSVFYMLDKVVRRCYSFKGYESLTKIRCVQLVLSFAGLALQFSGYVLIILYIKIIWIKALFGLSAVCVSVKYWENYISMAPTQEEDKKNMKKEKNKNENENKKENEYFPPYKFKSTFHKQRTKVTCLVNLWKIIFTFAAVNFIFLARSNNPKDGIQSLFNIGNALLKSIYGEQQFGDNVTCRPNVPFVVAVINIICDYICYKAAKTSCAIFCQRFGFGPPIIVLPLLSCVAFISLMHKPDIIKIESCDLFFSDWCIKGNYSLLSSCRDLVIAFIVLIFSILLITRHVWYVNGKKMGETDR